MGKILGEKALARRTKVERQRSEYRAAGLVQINVWVPAENKAELLEDCARLRSRRLRQARVEADHAPR